ncbi:hypothetical protein HanRHA438_Chr01g0039171 [Helianthus annuus]|uniref:Uncharacterized protein n=1 Tax=Helianthus annuus TaxID=4232 RepID=A0A9K3JYN5_HELAN|nr:hypothetical protein HanXRQr2_Chr01g0038161 [Helianthus annuus]KAJ0612768.1 hypothetical protein HanHA300_Chr01g0031071 [Helianthus annuus]KAJ0620414.1 hypothetical protein HanHA300_Chr00c1026g0833351 [Helianthus annuus]KAJ0628144.1 hypothetical protein HanHA89_Chr01g0033511 [Helianthus annuus]KAJ0784432.1 hypothetical protein HanLR1_Chr01g0032011 [Helianthus annuus]
MTEVPLDLRPQSYGSPQQPQNGSLKTQNGFATARKPSRMSLTGSRENDKFLPFLCRYLNRKKIVMMILGLFALMAFLSAFFNANRDVSESTIFNRFSDTYNTSLQFSRTFHSQNDDISNIQRMLSICEENPPTCHTSIESHSSDQFHLIAIDVRILHFHPLLQAIGDDPDLEVRKLFLFH